MKALWQDFNENANNSHYGSNVGLDYGVGDNRDTKKPARLMRWLGIGLDVVDRLLKRAEFRLIIAARFVIHSVDDSSQGADITVDTLIIHDFPQLLFVSISRIMI